MTLPFLVGVEAQVLRLPSHDDGRHGRGLLLRGGVSPGSCGTGIHHSRYFARYHIGVLGSRKSHECRVKGCHGGRGRGRGAC